MTTWYAVLIECLGIAVTGVGIGIEIKTHASKGHTVITCGAVLIAIGAFLYAKVGV